MGMRRTPKTLTPLKEIKYLHTSTRPGCRNCKNSYIKAPAPESKLFGKQYACRKYNLLVSAGSICEAYEKEPP